ncbi:MFS transporter [Sphingomonas sp. So64.6b]|uniref:spinster family MFS transporter n=1 Tax=Sphingomonas sp. So64.6b TaxID=2997354 RepID=UPI001601AC5E|nr:MFS transporter [Sphingomonas sp. So64.6b]QNA83346.1 MFS transporter [Sphingomonas sp. So64.6b]
MPISAASHPELDETLAMRRRTLTLGLLTLTYFFSYMDRQILAILLELIKADLKLSDTQLGLLAGFAFAIFYAGLGIPVARFADKANRRNIIAVSLALWSLMTALCGLAQNYVQLLLARIGVGVGEAGSSPPSHSIIADLYPAEKRASAMAIYSLGVVLGGGFGTMIGGWLASQYGWRIAIIAVGIPGIILAVVVRLFVVEPKRGLSDASRVADDGLQHGAQQGPQDEPMPSIWSAFADMWRNAAARHLVMAVTLTSLIGYATTSWGPSYLQRSLGFTVGQVALIVAPIAAIIGTVSGIGGGRVADWAAKRWGIHAQSWMVGLLKCAALPFTLLFFMTDVPAVAIGAYVFNMLFANSYLGPTFAMLQGLAPLRMRAMWAAITLLVINMIGLGLGPTMIGVLSDAYVPYAGKEESLRWALLTAVAATPWAIFHYWRAGVMLKRRQEMVA